MWLLIYSLSISRPCHSHIAIVTCFRYSTLSGLRRPQLILVRFNEQFLNRIAQHGTEGQAAYRPAQCPVVQAEVFLVERIRPRNNAKLFYDATMKWTKGNNLTCFYFEAFDEPWKSKGTDGSEGHFGLFTVDGKAKYALWDLVDAGIFEDLSRGGNPIVKTHGGDKAILQKKLKAPMHKKNQPDK
ncbi:MAG: hypothetical protein ABFR33_05105 [Verrucomicrobiota bacterium]